MKLAVSLCAFLLMGFTPFLTPREKNHLKQNLEALMYADQIAARVPEGRYALYTEERWNRFRDSVFERNQTEAQQMFKRYGFLGFDKVGREASRQFWALVQHCDGDPAFQSEVLEAMDQEVKRGNAGAVEYAHLYDRVQINTGKKQLFGTQVAYEVQQTGRAVPDGGLIDPARVDSIRKRYELEPLKEYLNRMTIQHYEMNKEAYQSRHIMQPDLYP